MTRQLKFRAWSKSQGKMFHPGMISETSQNTHCMGFSGMELMQYTGLKDKNGKEIYEGDILEDKARKYEVIFDEETAMFTVKHWKETALFVVNKQCEVVGNIYENPELLTSVL